MLALVETLRREFYENHVKAPPLPLDTPFPPFKNGFDHLSRSDRLISKGQPLAYPPFSAAVRMTWVDDLGMYIPRDDPPHTEILSSPDGQFYLAPVEKPSYFTPDAPLLPPHHRPEVLLAFTPTLPGDQNFYCTLLWKNLELRARGHPSPLYPNLLVFDLWENPDGVSKPYADFSSLAPYPSLLELISLRLKEV